MEFADITMTAAFLILPPILCFLVQNRIRVFIYSVISLWLLMIVGGQYHLAYTPNFNSFAPGISIVAGWVPASLYSGIWLGIALIFLPPRPNNENAIASDETKQTMPTESS